MRGESAFLVRRWPKAASFLTLRASRVERPRFVRQAGGEHFAKIALELLPQRREAAVYLSWRLREDHFERADTGLCTMVWEGVRWGFRMAFCPAENTLPSMPEPPICGLHCIVTDFEHHPIDSRESSFAYATAYALRELLWVREEWEEVSTNQGGA